MARGAYQLRDISDPMVRVYCPECHRFAVRARSTDRTVRRRPAKPSLLPILKLCTIGDGMSDPQCHLPILIGSCPSAKPMPLPAAGCQRRGRPPGIHGETKRCATKADIERAKRHVVDAEKWVAKQRVLVDELERDGYSTTEAHELLRVIVDLLDQMRTHADEIAKDVRRD